MFKDYLAKINAIGQAAATHENFVEIQRIQLEVTNAYAAGNLTDFEKRTLRGLMSIIMDDMRKELGLM